MLVGWQALFLAISSTLDDLGVGFAIGLNGRVSLLTAVIVAMLSGLTMVLGLYSGQALAGAIAGETAGYLSSAVFFAFAVWFAHEAYNGDAARSTGRRQSNTAGRSDMHLTGAIVLGLGLGVNSLGLGLSGGMAGYPIPLTTALTTGASFVFIWSGSRFGGAPLVQGLMKNWAGYCSALIMLLLGVIQFV